MHKETELSALDDRRWAAVAQRDKSSARKFLFGVATTGVYCRPGCSSRLPLRKNVRFYDSAGAARADGLRACLRCKPDVAAVAPETARLEDVRLFLESHIEAPATLNQLAERAGLSPAHLQRSFKAAYGVSPREYADQLRTQRLKRSLREARSGVTESIFDAGYGSLSRVYEKLDTRLGMTPMEYRDGGAGVSMTYASFRTPLGLAMVGATDRGLCFLHFGETAAPLLAELRRQYPKAEVQPMAVPAPPAFATWVAALNAYLTGHGPDPRLPVHVRATAFQMLVWQYLQTIPAGAVKSYREVAEALGKPDAVRAVARACATNTVALAIPCHRVLRGTGDLAGYRWGLERKRTLLDVERARRA